MFIFATFHNCVLHYFGAILVARFALRSAALEKMLEMQGKVRPNRQTRHHRAPETSSPFARDLLQNLL